MLALALAAAVQDDLGHLRLVDAATSAPIEGARVEAWTEDLDRDAVLLETASSGPDGSFTFSFRHGELRADKLRLRAPGYRTTVLHAETDEEVRLWPLGEPFRLRVLDLDGHPIEGARVRTHQSCEHAPPAVEGETDAEGRCAFPDFPPAADEPSLEIRAAGHGALTHVDPGTFLDRDTGEALVFLPRRLPVHLRLLDEHGAPLARRRIVVGESPEITRLRTDAAGRADVLSCFRNREVAIEIREGGEPLFVGGGWPLRDGVFTLRIGGEAFDAAAAGDAVAWLTLAVTPPLARSEQGDVRIVHPDGWTFFGDGEHAVPPGHLEIVVGRRFSSFEAAALPITLRPGERRALAVELRPAPRLELELPEHATVHVEVDDDSVTLDAPGRGPLVVPVPAGERTTVLVEAFLEDGRFETRRARLGPSARTQSLRFAAMELVRALPAH